MFALVDPNGLVVQVAVESFAVAKPFRWEDCSRYPDCGHGWWSDGPGVIVPPPPAVVAAPSAARRARNLIVGGLAVRCVGDPNLDGVYTARGTANLRRIEEVASLSIDGTFSDGSKTIEWLDADGKVHVFDVEHFRRFAKAAGAFVSACVRCIGGSSETLPSASVTIE